MEDYTLDLRGDIGAWVREAAMTGIVQLTLTTAATDPSIVPESCIRVAMVKLAQLAVEKIDRIRGHAGRTFATILFASNPPVPGIPRHQEVAQLFPKAASQNIDTFDWSVESKTFPIFTQLLRYPEYCDSVLLGLVVSMGGLTESLVKHSRESLYLHLGQMDSQRLIQFSQSLLDLFERNLKVDRVTLPLLKFLDHFLTSGLMDEILNDEENPFSFELYNLVKKEISKCGEPTKLLASADLMCALLQSSDKKTVSKCLVQLSIFLCHKFPKIRKSTASKLFEAILIYSDKEIVSDDKLDAVNSVLSDTNWNEASVEELRPIRNSLCELLGVQPPAILIKP